MTTSSRFLLGEDGRLVDLKPGVPRLFTERRRAESVKRNHGRSAKVIVVHLLATYKARTVMAP